MSANIVCVSPELFKQKLFEYVIEASDIGDTSKNALFNLINYYKISPIWCDLGSVNLVEGENYFLKRMNGDINIGRCGKNALNDKGFFINGCFHDSRMFTQICICRYPKKLGPIE